MRFDGMEAFCVVAPPPAADQKHPPPSPATDSGVSTGNLLLAPAAAPSPNIEVVAPHRPPAPPADKKTTPIGIFLYIVAFWSAKNGILSGYGRPASERGAFIPTLEKKMKNKALTLAIAAALSAPASFAATDQSGMRYTSASEGLYGFVNMRFQTKGTSAKGQSGAKPVLATPTRLFAWAFAAPTTWVTAWKVFIVGKLSVRPTTRLRTKLTIAWGMLAFAALSAKSFWVRFGRRT